MTANAYDLGFVAFLNGAQRIADCPFPPCSGDESLRWAWLDGWEDAQAASR